MIIDFSWPEDFSKSSFVIAKCNSDVFYMIENVNKWPNLNLLVYGPPFSGKTHLSKIFLKQNCGIEVNLKNLDDPIKSCCVVDSVEKLPEEKIMGIFYKTRPFNIPVLWISRAPLQFFLNDLNTRFNSIFSLSIYEPDEDTFKSILIKRCLDYGLIINEEILEYIVRRVDIKYKSINDLVLKLNYYCLEHLKAPSIPILNKIIHGVEQEEVQHTK